MQTVITERERYERAVETQEIIDMCKRLEKGELLPNEKIVETCSRSKIRECQGFCNGATKVLEREGILVVFHPSTRGGLYRLLDHEQVGRAGAATKQIFKKSKRERLRNSSIIAENLTEEQRRELLTTEAQLGVVQLFSQRTSAKKIAAAIGSESMQISETLRLFAPEPRAQ